MPTPFATWAAQQGVSRPFSALARMDQPSRRHIAELLSVDLRHARTEAALLIGPDPSGDTHLPVSGELQAEAEAVVIMGQSRTGIQARSHNAWRVVSPWLSNHSWREILLSVLDEFHVPPAQKRRRATEEELESAVFDYVADRILQQIDRAELAEVEKFVAVQPNVATMLRSLGFSAKGVRFVVSGIFTAAAKGAVLSSVTATQTAALLSKHAGSRVALNLVSGSAKVFLRTVNVVLWAWLAYDVLAFFFGPSRRRLLPVIAQLHQYHLLEKIEE